MEGWKDGRMEKRNFGRLQEWNGVIEDGTLEFWKNGRIRQPNADRPGFKWQRKGAFLAILCYLCNMIRLKRIPENIHQRMGSLTDLFRADPNIIFAYLFGGLLKERVNPLTDVDLSVYVRNRKKLDYLELFGKIARILRTDEIDLVILNDAPLALAGRILQNRRVLMDKKPFLRHKYESLILREFFDFTIKERNILKRRYGIG